jgi:phosphoglycerate kinase
MPKRSIADADVDGKRVLVRVDFNVPLVDGRVGDETRLRAALPTIHHLLDHGARVVLVSHLGRPKGAPDPRYRMAPVGERLAALLGQPVPVLDQVVGAAAEQAVAALPPGSALLLENVRFEPGEERNDPALADRLARLADLYVNDAFGSAHRAHASTVGVAERLPAYAGFLLLREIEVLSRLLEAPERPFVAILGGAKVSDKLAVAGNLLDRVDALLIGGGMANTFLLAAGHEIGASLVERDRLDDARRIEQHARDRHRTFLLPTDAIVAPSLEATVGAVAVVEEIPPAMAIYDIGPATIARFGRAIGRAKTVFWNGPMGVFERAPFAAGTHGVAAAVAAADAFTVVGGGDSVAAIAGMGMGAEISHISTGGGASLEFVEGKTLPGIAALPDAG